MSGGLGQPTREALLDLFGFYFGTDEIQHVVDQLALNRRGGFKAPDKILIVLFASRAGSNFFGQLLRGTGWFNEIGESFAPHQLQKNRDRQHLASLNDAAQWMIDFRGTNRARMLALTPISPFRPRRWSGAILPDDTAVCFNVLEPENRPVSAVADQYEGREVARVEVRLDRERSLTLLFDPEHALDERIAMEQFAT